MVLRRLSTAGGPSDGPRPRQSGCDWSHMGVRDSSPLQCLEISRSTFQCFQTCIQMLLPKFKSRLSHSRLSISSSPKMNQINGAHDSDVSYGTVNFSDSPHTLHKPFPCHAAASQPIGIGKRTRRRAPIRGEQERRVLAILLPMRFWIAAPPPPPSPMGRFPAAAE